VPADSRHEGACSAPTGVAQQRNTVNDASCVTTSYNAIWPFQVVLGLGMGSPPA